MDNRTSSFESTCDIEKHRQPCLAWNERRTALACLRGTRGIKAQSQHWLLSVLSLDHPVETTYTDVRPANCIMYRVLCNCHYCYVVQSRLCLSPLWFAHDPDNVMPAAVWRFNHREDHRFGYRQFPDKSSTGRVTLVTVHLRAIVEWIASKLRIVRSSHAGLLLITSQWFV